MGNKITVPFLFENPLVKTVSGRFPDYQCLNAKWHQVSASGSQYS